jgi:hypothetical protein
MASPSDLLLVPLIIAELACDNQTAYQWAQAMEERLSYYCQMGYIETIGELSAFVTDFLADYAKTEEQ